MKLFLSADMEGTAGVTLWEETETGKRLYDHFARQMSSEVAAACEGAIAGGADTFLSKNKAKSVDAKLAKMTKWVAILWILLTLSLSIVH